MMERYITLPRRSGGTVGAPLATRAGGTLCDGAWPHKGRPARAGAAPASPESVGMAVYTDVGDEELAAFVGDYDIGEVVSCKGIAEGVENSNFLLRTEHGTFILTLYEKRVAPADLPFFIALMEHLAAQGIACPTPIKARDGAALRRLCGRPAALISFLDGMWPRRIHPFHCAAVGDALARLHLAGAS